MIPSQGQRQSLVGEMLDSCSEKNNPWSGALTLGLASGTSSLVV